MRGAEARLRVKGDRQLLAPTELGVGAGGLQVALALTSPGLLLPQHFSRLTPACLFALGCESVVDSAGLVLVRDKGRAESMLRARLLDQINLSHEK